METVRACVLLLMQKRGASGLKRRLQWLQQQFIVMELSACTCPTGSKGDREKDFFFFNSELTNRTHSGGPKTLKMAKLKPVMTTWRYSS